jgi:hypothetical protein
MVFFNTARKDYLPLLPPAHCLLPTGFLLFEFNKLCHSMPRRTRTLIIQLQGMRHEVPLLWIP